MVHIELLCIFCYQYDANAIVDAGVIFTKFLWYLLGFNLIQSHRDRDQYERCAVAHKKYMAYT